MALGVQHQAFAAGREAEEIRAFWNAAHQKVLLDEPWLSTLLAQPPAFRPVPVTVPREEAGGREATRMRPAPGPRVDWGDALAVPTFYGREQELALLSHWVIQERCRVVSLLGLGGIGKSALAVQVMHRLADHFDVVIFRSLRDAPSCEEVLVACLQGLSPERLARRPASL